MRNGVPSRNEHFELHQKMLPTESLLFVGYVIKKALLSLTSLSSRHFATPPLVTLRNDVSETSAEIQC